MEGCCILKDAPMVETMAESVLVSDVSDSIPRGEFDAAIRRLERRMEELEMELRGLKVPDPSNPEPHLKISGVHFSEIDKDPVAEVLPKETHVKDQDPADHTSDAVHFGDSVWSLPLVLDLKRFPLWDFVFAALLLLVNLGTQATFSAILLSDNFAGAGVQVDEEIDNARRWRVSIAHDYRYMDLSETSLATRVCQSDGALILSTPQAELIDQINSFLGLGPQDFEPGFLQPGILLCSLCILHWSLCVYKEFRSVWLAFEAVICIPRASRSRIVENRLTALSLPRLFVVLMSFVLRMVIATIMLVAGINWLGRTTSITELMLNAVALNGIMDVDELLFVGFTPVSVQHAIRKLEPITMKYSRSRSQCESLALFLLLAATMLLPYLLLLEPLAVGMVGIKWEMCGRNQTFVVASNPLIQQIVGFKTQEARNAEEKSLIEIAVDRHKFQVEGPPEYIFFSATRSQFNYDLNEEMMAAAGRTPFCIETDALRPGSPISGDPIIEPILHARLRSALVSLDQAPGISCDGLGHLCHRPDARLLRLMCGDTCGCTDPFASPWHKVQAQGCSPMCTARASMILATKPCEDQAVGDVWTEFWDGYAGALADFYGQNVSQSVMWPVASNVMAQLRIAGCSGLRIPELQMETISQTSWCMGHEKLFRPLAWICPKSCGCLGNFAPHCPANCQANATLR